MVKRYYEPYEQMYKKVDIETGEKVIETKHIVEEEMEDNPMGEVISSDAEIITPIRQEVNQQEETMIDEEVNEIHDDKTSEASKTVSEQDAAAYIVQDPIHKLSFKNIFERIEIDDLIIIGLIIILLLEEGEDIPLILVLGFLLLSDFF